MIKFHSSVLYVSDIEASKHFYCEVLFMPIDMDMGFNVILKNGLTLWQIQKDNIVVRTIGVESLKAGHKFELYFETDDMADVERRIASNGVKHLHQIHQEPWGQNTIRVFDPDGNIVEIGEELKTFLRRMIGSGMSLKAVCEKTGMRVEDVERALIHK